MGNGKFYPELGATLTELCERLGRELNMAGLLLLLWRGGKEEGEMGVSVSPEFVIDDFVNRVQQLGAELADGKYRAGELAEADTIASATGAQYVLLVAIDAEGSVWLRQSQMSPAHYAELRSQAQAAPDGRDARQLLAGTLLMTLGMEMLKRN